MEKVSMVQEAKMFCLSGLALLILKGCLFKDMEKWVSIYTELMDLYQLKSSKVILLH